MGWTLGCFQDFAITNNAVGNNFDLWVCIFQVNSWKWDCCIEGHIHMPLFDDATFPSERAVSFEFSVGSVREWIERK